MLCSFFPYVLHCAFLVSSFLPCVLHCVFLPSFLKFLCLLLFPSSFLPFFYPCIFFSSLLCLTIFIFLRLSDFFYLLLLWINSSIVIKYRFFNLNYKLLEFLILFCCVKTVTNNSSDILLVFVCPDLMLFHLLDSSSPPLLFWNKI